MDASIVVEDAFRYGPGLKRDLDMQSGQLLACLSLPEWFLTAHCLLLRR